MTKRVPIIAANWKMHKTGVETEEFLNTLNSQLLNPPIKIFVAPAFTALSRASAIKSPALIGAQNMHEADEGAFTGEVSARMLKEAGARFVILGHSERRHLFHETDALIQKKLKKALTSQLLPILCVGETLAERETGKTFEVLTRQLKTALEGSAPAEIILAYEPVWAIGTGKTATPEMAGEAHQFCRDLLKKIWGEGSAIKTSILYGGSVTPENISGLAKQPDIDGALVGGASLDVHKFIQIIQGFKS
ncbi:MAG: triose-phosphate isomerase [Verrucomicrobia bacterium]|nr:triose-phosphate isomerase [Verrucomicrobiota bacterium]